MKLYEAMFVMDVQSSPDTEAMESEIRRVLDRAGAEVSICRRWEDRRLAFEINNRKRGSYWLTYFNAEPDRIVGIERDVQLSERVLRVLVLRVDQIPQAELAPPEAEAKAEAAPAEGAKPGETPAPAAEGQPAAQPGGVAPTPPAADEARDQQPADEQAEQVQQPADEQAEPAPAEADKPEGAA